MKQPKNLYAVYLKTARVIIKKNCKEKEDGYTLRFLCYRTGVSPEQVVSRYAYTMKKKICVEKPTASNTLIRWSYVALPSK